MEPYGTRLRMRIMELYEQEKSTAEIAALLGTCPSGTRRVRQHVRERGPIQPLPPGGGREPVMDAAAQQRLRERVAAQPDATLAELRQQLHDADGPLVSIASIDRWCKRLGLRLKKVEAGIGAGSPGRESGP